MHPAVWTTGCMAPTGPVTLGTGDGDFVEAEE